MKSHLRFWEEGMALMALPAQLFESCCLCVESCESHFGENFQ